MDLTTIDYVLLAVIGALAVIGMFKGLSGWLGTLTGAAVGTAAGYFAFGYCLAIVDGTHWVSGPFVRLAAAVLDFLVGLVAFGLARRLAVKFFSFLVPQPLNAIIGMGGGLFLGLMLAVILAGTAFFEGGALADGFLATRSRIVHFVAMTMESRLEGRDK